MKKGSGIWNSKFLHKLCRFEKSHYVKDFKWNDDASKAFVPYIDLVGHQNDHSVNTVLICWCIHWVSRRVHQKFGGKLSPVWVSLLLLQVTAPT